MQTQTQPLDSPEVTTQPPPIRYCLYVRKSTESDEKQALSIDSQIKEMLALAAKENLQVVEIRKESHSAKASGQRPIFNQLIEDIRAGKFNAILTWAPDRLSRNAGDLGALVDLMDQKILVEIRTYSQKFTNSPNEKFLLMILCSQAKLENDNKSINIKRGMKARVSMGLWPAVAPTGYLNEKNKDKKCEVIIDSKRAPIIKQMFEKATYNEWSGRKLYYWLKDEINFTTKNGKHLALANVYLILKNSFYTGTFEYPRGGGNWYQGKHQPIISQKLFDQVQKQITSQRYFRYASKEFAFTKLIKCGLCGSGITADEKFKKLKDGSTARYVYYGCTRGRDHSCKCGYIREELLLSQLLDIIDQLSLNEIGMKYKLEKEVERYSQFKKHVLGIKEENKEKNSGVDLKDYAKYILKQGSIIEKRELLSCLKSKLVLSNKILKLEN